MESEKEMWWQKQWSDGDHHSQGMQAGHPVEAGKGKDTDSSLDLPEEMKPCWPILDFWPQDCRNKFVLF